MINNLIEIFDATNLFQVTDQYKRIWIGGVHC
jgi:hypothetical protein